MINQTVDCAKVSMENCLADFCCTGASAYTGVFETYQSPIIPILLFAFIVLGIGAIVAVVQEIKRK